ncbi:hypothetical protein AGABI1DRAFT_132163 [Agaricus bisporus var. burnettii JB137-S8]|uniref:Zn(2)-C6 fungal-type domain-containing protein n=1 Tax=Agaricus bisporus var. burnettii (strain JB137-S8 / ATCC MYA-4627 / FGSC 10392) TaxID=597362 RepID=K5VM43_AGABU|nr:uncharacterized protein AGABI1DRAFT_132163 [Agaricus bisporus var. burnettii JB137-S8]EKM75494.1 hypothetical protein AGABI1DRAFT_132163 [Agaricus bisporus var. burnettii JB137-S8]
MSESRTSSRPIQSCFQCRKRKIKCSKSYPCTPCILRGEGDACREVDKAQLQEHRKSCERIEELVDRIQKLENTISVLSSRGSPSNEESPRSIRRRELSSTPYSKSPSPVSKRRSCSRNLCSPVPTLLRTGSRDEEVALILEDFVMGRKVNQTRAVDGHCVSSYNTPSSSSENHPINGLNSNPWSLWVNSPPEFVSRLSPILPNHARIQLLLHFYVQRLDWYAKVLHVPSFLAKSNAILTHIDNHRFELVDVGFLGVLLAVLCLAFHFADASLCEQLFLDYSACSEYAQQLYTGAQACLQYSNFTGSQTLEHLQNIILTGVYQQNNDESDSQWALTGAAIKIAQNLGMSRLGSETGLHQYPLEWRSSIKREVARRVWWCLVLNDWSCAMAHQGVYSIHPSQNHTSLPANIDDVDLGESDVVQSKPPNIHTEMSSFLCRLRFIDIQRQLVDESNRGGYDLDFVNDMEYKINNVISDLNDHFQMVLDSRKKPSRPNDARCSERTLCQIIGQGLILQLNRPFLFRSYHDKRYVQARSQCIKAARLILQHLNANLQGERLLRWSIPVSNAFAATCAICAVTGQTSKLENAQLSSRVL